MKIIIEDYNPDWQRLFSEESVALGEILADLGPRIEHVGSTSVEGLAAKPIIDIMVGFGSEDRLNEAAARLTRPGYIYFRKWEALMPYRRFIVKVQAGSPDYPLVVDEGDEFPGSTVVERTHHIHMVQTDSEFWERHLLFRDYLRQESAAREQYMDLKRGLAKRDWSTGNDYADAKTDFIRGIEKKAAEKLVRTGRQAAV